MAKAPAINYSQRAVALTEQYQKLLGPTDAFVRSELKAFGGVLSTVTFKANDGRLLDCFVFFKNGEEHFFFNSTDLSRHLDREASGSRVTVNSMGMEILRTGGAPGLIAVVIVLVIAFIAIQGGTIPDILANALTTILGFYFGTRAIEGRGDKK
jgi:hypothetical protein